MRPQLLPGPDAAEPFGGSAYGLGEVGKHEIESLYRTQGQKILRFFMSRSSGRDDASDLAQDVFRRLIQMGGENIRHLERPEAYLHQIARNLLRDRAKTARRRSHDLHICSDDAILESSALEPQLEARDMLNRVDAAMLQLKPRTREVFMACRVDGLSYAEIRERTGLSFKIIEKEMARALAHIHRTVGRE